ncbi:MAG: orotidine-5'-phosphate decarboxylase [Proteobacteria bacterium]|nr:orotidine-5'-phosphate decarboxylase [Pseudomonadota bacterium]
MCALRPADRVFVALDTPDMDGALSLAGSLAGVVGGIKLGKAFFTANGPQGVRRAAAAGLPVFLDLKFHDIPNTVADAVRAALSLAPVMLTVHASGGAAMMRAAADAAGEAGADRPLVLGVTVLTSLGADDLAATGLAGPVPDQVMRLARLAQASGLDGVVCSAREAAALRAECGADFKLVVPGIRPAGAAAGDQKRTATPAEAMAAGADYLVIGRPVTGAGDPAQAARAIIDEIEAA